MLTSEEIKQILTEQRAYLLQKKLGIERTILNDINKKIKLPHVIVLTGLRRSGKSTILRQIIRKYYADEDFYYINFEDERLFNFPANDFNHLYEVLIQLYGKKKTFFIDEIQNITHFETFVRRFYEDGFKFFITGSSANLLSKELGTKLTGRHVDIIVKPFSFMEFLTLKEFKLESKSMYTTESKAELKNYFDDYLLNGGMPEFAIYRDKEIIAKIYEDTILKDIAVRYKVENVFSLKELCQYLITNFAVKFSFQSLKNIMNFGSVNTVKKFICYLEETHFAKTINKFDYSAKKQIINDKKLYVVDNAFILTVSKKITKDKGWLLENLVFNSLNKEQDIFYYKETNECDFVLAKNKEITQAIQVCYELNVDNKRREIDGLCEALEKFKLQKGLILTYDYETELKIKNKQIIIMPVWKWLLVSSTENKVI